MTGSAHTTGHYTTDDGHQLYWERHGTPGAEPVFFLHGGPGGRSSHDHLTFFDLSRFDVILFDQRGCGRSTPYGGLHHNDTGQAVDDIDALRRHLGLDKISLLGISWGSWLAIQYQQRYRSTLVKTTLVSVFVPFPGNISAYEYSLSDGLPALTANDSTAKRIRRLYRALSVGNPGQQRQAAIEWIDAVSPRPGPAPSPSWVEDFVDEAAIRAIRLELHYHLNQYFFTPADEGVSLDNNTLAIQGIKDSFGLASLRWLRQRTPVHCQLRNAGHNAFSASIIKAVRTGLVRTAHP